MKIVLLASGSGSLARAICEANIPQVSIQALICDKECGAVSIANDFSIPSHVLPMKSSRAEWDTKLTDLAVRYDPELVVSVGFMKILAPIFLEQFPTINTHPALLPLFPGAHAVRDALASGATETGCTVHWVDEGVDTGAVIAQRSVEILAGDTEVALHERIKIQERKLIVEVLAAFSQHGIPENH